jgi:hypothetical protein
MLLFESFLSDEGVLIGVLMLGFLLSLGEIFILALSRTRSAILKLGFFHNICSGLFLMAAFFSYVLGYVVLCIPLFFLSGVSHFMALKILLKKLRKGGHE